MPVWVTDSNLRRELFTDAYVLSKKQLRPQELHVFFILRGVHCTTELCALACEEKVNNDDMTKGAQRKGKNIEKIMGNL